MELTGISAFLAIFCSLLRNNPVSADQSLKELNRTLTEKKFSKAITVIPIGDLLSDDENEA